MDGYCQDVKDTPNAEFCVWESESYANAGPWKPAQPAQSTTSSTARDIMLALSSPTRSTVGATRFPNASFCVSGHYPVPASRERPKGPLSPHTPMYTIILYIHALSTAARAHDRLPTTMGRYGCTGANSASFRDFNDGLVGIRRLRLPLNAPVMRLFVQQSKTQNGPPPRFSLLASVQGLTAILEGGAIHFSG